MGGVPIKHHSKSKVGRRRSQLALKPQNLIPCKGCKSPTFSHKACPNCGMVNKGTKKTKKTS